jgi:hypothetical protein
MDRAEISLRGTQATAATVTARGAPSTMTALKIGISKSKSE